MCTAITIETLCSRRHACKPVSSLLIPEPAHQERTMMKARFVPLIQISSRQYAHVWRKCRIKFQTSGKSRAAEMERTTRCAVDGQRVLVEPAQRAAGQSLRNLNLNKKMDMSAPSVRLSTKFIRPSLKKS